MSDAASDLLHVRADGLIPEAVLGAIFEQYRMPVMGTHGLAHWARVLDNGLTIADRTDADAEVVALFAVFHDACRINDHWDLHHGPKAADLVEALRPLVADLGDARIALLREACRDHTSGGVHSDPTIGACWDADRLDLGRVGIRPAARFLSTEVARDQAIIAEATRRAVSDHVHTIVSDVWLPLAQGDPRGG